MRILLSTMILSRNQLRTLNLKLLDLKSVPLQLKKQILYQKTRLPIKFPINKIRYIQIMYNNKIANPYQRSFLESRTTRNLRQGWTLLETKVSNLISQDLKPKCQRTKSNLPKLLTNKNQLKLISHYRSNLQKLKKNRKTVHAWSNGLRTQRKNLNWMTSSLKMR